MRCTDCGLYECCMRTPLGGCPNGEKTEPSRIYTTPNTGHGPWEKDYQPSGIQDPIKEAALALVDAVERYTMGKCLRSELLNTKESLKKIL